MNKLYEKRDALKKEKRALHELTVTENRGFTEAEEARWTELNRGIADVNAAIVRQKEVEADAAQEAEETRGLGRKTDPVVPEEGETRIAVGRDLEAARGFRNLGEQLAAIHMAAVRPDRIDKRLLSIQENRAATGMNQAVDSEGGYALQTEFAGALFESAVSAGQLASLVDTHDIGAGFDGAQWLEVDEDNVSETVFGGVQVYWAAEADSVTNTKPKLRERELKLRKLMGMAYATGEMVQDSTWITSLFTKAFTLAISRKLDEGIISGEGAAGLKGILKGNGLISVAKVSGQGADTVKYKNLVAMWNRIINQDTAVWLMHPDVLEELFFMEFPVGTGGVPVFLPPGGASAAPYHQLFNRPILRTDKCSALGDVGDVILTDPKEYMLLKKGGIQADTSIHVRFANDEQAFRFIFKTNGQPKRNSALTIDNSSKTRSPYVALAARA